MQPRDVMLAIAKKTGDIGASFYFVPETRQAKELGIDGFRFYFAGRGGVLGGVDSGVVRSAFGYFHPKLVARMWNSATAVVPAREARVSTSSAARARPAEFGDVVGLEAYVAAAASLIAAVDGSAMALFAGVRAEPVPDDAPAAAIHQAMVCARCAAAPTWRRYVPSGCDGHRPRHQAPRRHRAVRLEGRVAGRHRRIIACRHGEPKR